MKKIAIFASGSGTNAEAITHYFAENADIKVALIVSSRPDAFVLTRAARLGVPAVVLTGRDMKEADRVLALLRDRGIDFIVLAGYLLRIPPYLVEAYPRAIVNIHPALLPLHGGKGMYGDFVHEDVLRCGDTESGITIHYVNEQYDAGDIIFQAKCPVLPGDTVHSLAERIHTLEHAHFPHVVAETIALL